MDYKDTTKNLALLGARLAGSDKKLAAHVHCSPCAVYWWRTGKREMTRVYASAILDYCLKQAAKDLELALHIKKLSDDDDDED